MASKRMFFRGIVESSTFLKMPLSTQALYFHLGLQADDDGIVDGWVVTKLVGSSEDDFKILIAKRFIVALNDEMLVWIKDFVKNNNLPPSKITYSIHRELLIQVIPEAKEDLVYKDKTAQTGMPDYLRKELENKFKR